MERKENLNYFDKLYKNIKINLFRKTGNLSAFSKTFFSFIDIKILKFFNRIFMIRVFIRIKNDEEPFYSIINEKNYISKESLTYITKAIIHEKECNGDTQKFLDYFELLFDYIFFEHVFICDISDINDKIDNNNIYDIYYSYYGKLSAHNNNNYLCFYEPIHKNTFDISFHKKWNDYIREEYKNHGLKILFKILDNLDEFYIDKKPYEEIKKEKNKTKDVIKKQNNNSYKYNRKGIYDIIFEVLEKKLLPYKEISPKDILDINAIIKLILYEGNKSYIFKIYENSQEKIEEKDKRIKLFHNIIKKIMENLLSIDVL